MTLFKNQLNAFRRSQLLGAAVATAERVGWHGLTREAIAVTACCSAPLVSHYLGDMDAIRTAIMTEAVRQERLGLIAQGVAAGHPVAVGAPEPIRARALQSLI